MLEKAVNAVGKQHLAHNKEDILKSNESCDLDSAVSALVYATFLSWQHCQIKCKVCTHTADNETNKDEIFLPMLMVERDDYPLKTEVEFCFKEHGILASHLIFSDDIDLMRIVSTHKANIILVDHHILSDKYSNLVQYVSEIIDHRPRNKNVWKYKNDVRSTIEIVGSCATLVTQRICDLSALLSKGGDFFMSYPVCANLLYSVIILDTVNFSKTVNKATPHDKDMTLFLESILKPSKSEEERKLRLDRLVKARRDVSSLTAAQLLRKDLKINNGVLVPAFPILVEEFLDKSGALVAVNETIQTTGCDMALLLGMDLSHGLKRDGAIVSRSDDGESLLHFLQEWSNSSLQLEPVIKEKCLYFKQINLSASRKQYMLALNEFPNTK